MLEEQSTWWSGDVFFMGGGCQNPHHLESMGKYLQWNAAFFFTGSSALAKIVGPQEEDLHPWKRSHWSTPGSDSSDIQEGMVEDDEPHLDSSLDMTWQCVDDLENAKRLVVVHQFLDLCFFLPCKSDLFALWRQFGQPAGIMTLCEAYANSCFDRTYVGALQVFWHFNAFPKSAEVLLVENLLCFAWNCNQTGYCCISFRIMWLSVMFIAFFVILLTCPRCPSLDFWLPSIPPCNSQADAPVLEAETQQWWVQAWMLSVCVCFWNFLLRPFRIYSDTCVNWKQNEGNVFDSWIPVSYDLIRTRQSSLVVA